MKCIIHKLLEKALIKETGFNLKQLKITIKNVVAYIETPNEKFVVLLSERNENVFKRESFALTEDGIDTIRLFKAKYIFFHSQDCSKGILMGSQSSRGNWVTEYIDEFNDRIWIYIPLNHPKVTLRIK